MGPNSSDGWELIHRDTTVGLPCTALTVDKRGYVYWASSCSSSSTTTTNGVPTTTIFECVDGVTDRRAREAHDPFDEGRGPVLAFKRGLLSPISAMCTTPGGWLCACFPAERRVVLFSRAIPRASEFSDGGEVRVVDTGTAAVACVANRRGQLFLADVQAAQLVLLDFGPEMMIEEQPRRHLLALPGRPTGLPRSLALSPDQRQLLVCDAAAAVWQLPLNSEGGFAGLPIELSLGRDRDQPHDVALCTCGGPSAGVHALSSGGELRAVTATGSTGGSSQPAPLPSGDVTSTALGAGRSAPWARVVEGVQYDMRRCMVYVSSRSTRGFGEVWRCVAQPSLGGLISSEDPVGAGACL
eukprot:COSAG01_NODE_2869_length_6945_cov_4.032428_3_plen_355_part_00